MEGDSSDGTTDKGQVGRKGLRPPACTEIKPAEVLSETGNLEETGCGAAA